jgi:3-deoxy-manno-octulosonate cytidylyltransferase (CMP-KDO synthetase)
VPSASYRVVVPARYGSTRFPGKALVSLLGKPMIQWVYQRARRSGAREVLIATDDNRIMQAVRDFGATAVLTAATHRSGTDRIAEVARLQRWEDAEIVVNVQGDEPLLPESLIEQVAVLLASHPRADVATLATAVESAAALLDPNVVKVVTDREQRALYFSRAPIPWERDAARVAEDESAPRRHGAARRQLGL